MGVGWTCPSVRSRLATRSTFVRRVVALEVVALVAAVLALDLCR
jgi:hypothetical protein